MAKSTFSIPQSSVCLRQFEEVDRLALKELLVDLPKMYPGAGEWLDNRLDAAIRGEARCTVATLSERIVGVIIETPKRLGAMKLSTLFVSVGHRRQGIATQLLGFCRDRWADQERVYITVPAESMAEVAPLLRKFEFTICGLEANRYGKGRDEFIFEYLPVGRGRGL